MTPRTAFHGPHFHLSPETAANLALPAALLLLAVMVAFACSAIPWS